MGGGWSDKTKLMLNSAFNLVEVEVEAELGKKRNFIETSRKRKAVEDVSTGNKKPKILSQVHLIVNIVRKYSQGKIILFVMWEINIKNNFALDWIKIARNILKTFEKHLTRHGKKDFFQCRCCGIVLRTILNLTRHGS